jgi:hypothetical protein
MTRIQSARLTRSRARALQRMRAAVRHALIAAAETADYAQFWAGIQQRNALALAPAVGGVQ